MLLFTDAEWYNEISPADLKKVAEQAKAWMERLVAQGKFKDGRGLGRSGARVVAKTGRVISDGPYAESKEAIGGFCVVEVESLEEAIEIAKSNPTVPYGTTIEIRPVHRGEEDCPLFRRVRHVEPEPANANA
jgi:hypothetical protein